MAGGAIAGTIQEGGTPYFRAETLARWRNASQKYLPLIVGWIQQANQVIHRSEQMRGYENSLFKKTFENPDTGQLRTGVGFKGAEGGNQRSVTLQSQWQSVVLHSSRQNANYQIDGLINDSILTRGYYILTRLGEAIRGDGDVHYKIVAHDGHGLWTKATEYNLNLLQFLNFGTNQNNAGLFGGDYFSLKVSRKDRLASKMSSNNIKGRDWTMQELWEFNQFVYQVSRIVTLKGKQKVFEHGGDLKVNDGHLLEAFLQLGFHYKYRIKGNKAQWQELKAQAQRLRSMSAPKKGDENMDNAIQDTLKDPSPFWQGGEGGRLKNIQVKGNEASVTNMLSLVRQMTRVYSILIQLPSKISQQVETKTLNASLQFSDDEAIEALVEMFYREGWKNRLQITIPL